MLFYDMKYTKNSFKVFILYLTYFLITLVKYDLLHIKMLVNIKFVAKSQKFL